MTDGAINETKDSRLIKADLPATYEQLRTMAAADGLPIDLLINLAGWLQTPTFLNKANLLKDATAALYGKGAAAVPDDIFAYIAPVLFGKSKIITGSYTGNGATTKTITIGEDPLAVFVFGQEVAGNSYPVIGVMYKNGSYSGGNRALLIK